MRIREEVRLAVVGLLGFQLVASGGAVLLIGRMSPAIDQILTHNAQAVQAIEQMTLQLAVTTSTVTDRRAKFDAALARAKESLSTPQEAAAMGEVEKIAPKIFTTNPDPV